MAAQVATNNKPLLIRIVTVPISFKHLIKGQASYFVSRGFEVLQVSADGPEKKDVQSFEQVPYELVPFTRSITPLQDINCLVKLIRLFRKSKPLIVHTQTPKAGLLGMIAARLTGIPVRIHTVGGLPLTETTGLKRKLLLFVERLTYACAQVVVPNSKELGAFMQRQGLLPAHKMRLLGAGSSNGIDTDFFSISAVKEGREELRALWNIPQDALVFIFIGRLVGDKGINELINAFSRLSADHPLCRLLLVGPTEEELDPLSADTIATIETHTGIISAGYQSDVRPFLKMSDILCFPSYREGFPNVPMQAGAMELGLIVSDINGCNEIVVDGKNGWIVPAKNTEALYARMLWTLQHPEAVQEVRESVRESISERYGQQQIWEAIHDLYEGQLAKSGYTPG